MTTGTTRNEVTKINIEKEREKKKQNRVKSILGSLFFIQKLIAN